MWMLQVVRGEALEVVVAVRSRRKGIWRTKQQRLKQSPLLGAHCDSSLAVLGVKMAEDER